MRIELVADEAPVAPIRQSFGGRGGGRGGRFNGGNRLVILFSCLHLSKLTVCLCSYLENKTGKEEKVTQGPGVQPNSCPRPRDFCSMGMGKYGRTCSHL